MFILCKLADTVRTKPHSFNKPFHDELIESLNKKFANKVVFNLGLCVCFYDFEKIGDSYILPGDGSSYTKVVFRFVVFRPFIDEIVLGKIKSCSADGVTVSITFFDDILIPKDKLPHPSRFQDTEQIWVWDYQTDDGTAELFMEPGSEVRFKVVEEKFSETRPIDGSAPPDVAQPVLEDVVDDNSYKKIPYQIIGSMSEAGLGCLQWWNS
uniref:DNA-directed RNA polymerase III subunit RPC8 n=1 Tax=Romanomermis culicivorax TaxID=13658 RepID=A0A915KEP7_ROMCU